MNRPIEIAVISLPGSPRRASVEARMATAPVAWRFFDAKRGDDVSAPAYDERATLQLWGRPLSNGEIGCFASHVALLAEFSRSQGSPWLLVAEDDVALDFGFPFDRLAAAAEAAGVDYVRLYARYLLPFRHVGFFRERQIVRFRGKPLGTQAYLITRRGAERFVGSVDRIERPVDHELDRYWANGLDCYAVFPHPAFEAAGQTSVVKVDPAKRSLPGRVRSIAWRVGERLRRELRDRQALQTDARWRRAIASLEAERS